MHNKKVNKTLLRTYIKENLNTSYNFNFTDIQTDRLIDGIEQSLKNLIMDRYSFRFLGFSFEVSPRPAYTYIDVNDKKIKTSDPYYGLKVKVPQKLAKELKEHTRYKSLDEPITLNTIKNKNK